MENNNKIPVLLYHSISDNIRIAPQYSLTPAEFRNHLEYLCENGIACLTAEYLNDFDSHEELADRSCLITFDDGYDDNYYVAYPLLKDFHMKATFFIITDRVCAEGYMNWEQLREMHENGMSIQSHTASHSYLSYLSKDRLVDELSKSKKALERELSSKISSLSLPYGDFNRTVIDESIACGYKTIFSSQIGYVEPEAVLAPRINIDGDVSMEKFASIVHGKRGAIGMLRAKQLIKDFIKKKLRYRKH